MHQLSKKDIYLFYKLHPALLFFVNDRCKVLKKVFKDPEELRGSGLDNIGKIRKVLWKNTALIDAFAKENPFHFSERELNIVLGWKCHIQKKFFLLKMVKEYALFFDDENPAKVYGVKALASPFENLFSDPFPLLVEAVLIPFQGKIIGDGIFYSFPVSLGAGIRSNLNKEAFIAKSRFGIITSLPFLEEKKKENDAEKLRRYLQTKRSREYFKKEICALMLKSRPLEILYHQESGKRKSREIKSDLRKRGIQSGCFGILQDMVVASGETPEQLEEVLRKIVPSQVNPFVFRLRLKEKK